MMTLDYSFPDTLAIDPRDITIQFSTQEEYVNIIRNAFWRSFERYWKRVIFEKCEQTPLIMSIDLNTITYQGLELDVNDFKAVVAVKSDAICKERDLSEMLKDSTRCYIDLNVLFNHSIQYSPEVVNRVNSMISEFLELSKHNAEANPDALKVKVFD